MKLFFELGNTRIKSSMIDSGEYEFIGAVDKLSIESGEFLQLLGLDGLSPSATSVYFCSVLSSKENADFIEQIKHVFKCYPTELRTQPKCCGIKNGYEAFESLGVDRWMSIIAASSGSSKPILIVSAGTAMTIDVVVDKVHLGGFIVPGLSLMRRSLASNTAGLTQYELPVHQDNVSLMATNTENAILGGTLYMAASYINTVINDLEIETGRKFDCIGTGGDFLSMVSLLDKSFYYVEDLTLQGMFKVVESF